MSRPRIRGRVTPADVLCLGGLAAVLTWVSVSTVFVPSLIGSRPVFLEIINGGTTTMLAAGAFARIGKTLLVWAIFAPVVSWVPFDPLAWWAGRRYGRSAAEALLRRTPALHGMVERTERAVRRFDWLAVPLAPWLPLPTTLVYAAAGWTGMKLWQFVLLDLAGTVVRSAAMVGIGYAVGGDAVDLARTVSHNATIATIALVAVLVAWYGWRGVRARSSVTR